jgi:hypothetical protein
MTGIASTANMITKALGWWPARLIGRAGRSLLLGWVILAGCVHDKPQGPGGRVAPTTAVAQEDGMTNEKAAQAATEAWLSIVDAGDYAKSWTEAAAGFQRVIDGPGWKKALNGVRAPLGKVLSRTFTTAKYSTTLPGAPDGEYVVIQFDTSFEKKQRAVETVTAAREPDGRWRVSGYFIK